LKGATCTVPCMLHASEDRADDLRLAESVGKRGLSPWEKGLALVRAQAKGTSAEKFAPLLECSGSHARNLRLLHSKLSSHLLDKMCKLGTEAPVGLLIEISKLPKEAQHAAYELGLAERVNEGKRRGPKTEEEKVEAKAKKEAAAAVQLAEELENAPSLMQAITEYLQAAIGQLSIEDWQEIREFAQSEIEGLESAA